MEKTNFWKDALKYGAVLGAVLALSSLLEYRLQLAGSIGAYWVFTFEWLTVVVLHYYLLHRFTRNRAALYSPEEGFTFAQGYGYILSMSAVAGVIVGTVQYLYLHLFLGYANYTGRLVAALTDMISQSTVPASLEPILAQAMSQIEHAPEPTLVATVWGGVFTSLLFGVVFGLIIAGVLSRAPKPFGNE